jgi:oligopeptidase B
MRRAGFTLLSVAALAIVLLSGGFGSLGDEARLTPPVAKRVEHRETRHGETVVDEYFWLREKTNPEVLGHLEAENAYTDGMTAGVKAFEETLYQEMLARIKQTDLSTPVRRGSYYYYSRMQEGRQYSVYCRRKGNMDAAEEVLLDGNALAEGHSFFALSSVTISDDENLLAYATDTTGYRQYVLHVKDLRSGETLDDTAERVTSIEWSSDNKTLFYTTEDEVTKRSDRMWRHALGDESSEPVYEEANEVFRLDLSRSRDRKFIFLNVINSDSSEVHYLDASDPRCGLRLILAREPHHRYRVDHREGQFYIRTNKGAKNFQVVTAPVDDPDPRNWKVFIEEQQNVLLDHLDLFKNFAVVRNKANALSTVRVLDFRSGQWRTLDFPDPVYSLFAMGNPEYEARTFRYSYQSMVTPSAVYDFDMETHESELLKQQEVLGGYDPAQYVCERLWATARDGVKVPISIVYKKGFKRDGTAPMWLYAYGSYGVGLSPSFSSDRVSLLDRGMSFAIAHVRGGNEMGEAWREAGMLMNKKNTFNDFIDCAEFLIQEKWTTNDRLVIEGASAGGLLVGAVVNMRPDLFGAVLCAVPFVDVMNTMMDASLPLTTSEYMVWGDPRQKPAYDYMKSYSPYDNLAPRRYPPMLVTTGLNDSQVMYWEPTKYVARLRAMKTDTNPLLLKVNMSAGHGGASGRYDKIKEQAFEYAWLLSQVGIIR